MSDPTRLIACWLDDDGQHVWLRHRCLNQVDTSMLRYPAWRAVNGQVQPSIVCNDCGLHVFTAIGEER
jgi:hypothetical protein